MQLQTATSSTGMSVRIRRCISSRVFAAISPRPRSLIGHDNRQEPERFQGRDGLADPRQQLEIIEAARRTRDLKKSPEPFVLWAQLADYAINYQVNAFTTRGASLPRILSDLHRNIVDVFNENGVQIMTPSYEADPQEPKIPTEAWDGRLAKIE